MNAQTKENDSEQQAAAQYQSIVDMLYAADDENWERLAELEELAEDEPLDNDDLKELADLRTDLADYSDAENAREAISESPLSVQVRSDWHAPGEDATPSEFEILLCTGGPAVRILGELDEYGQPRRAWLEHQDWGTPWTQWFGASQDTLVAYASNFYFGDGR